MRGCWHEPHFGVLRCRCAWRTFLITCSPAVNKVSCMALHVVGCVRTTGALYSWGCGRSGQLGLGDDIGRCEPTLIEDESLADAHVVKVSDFGLPGKSRACFSVMSGYAAKSLHTCCL